MPLGELPAGGVGARKAFGSANAGQLAPGAIHSALIPPGRGSFPAPQRRSGLYVPFLPAPISVLSKYMRSLPQRCLSLQPAFREEPSRLPLRFKAAAQAFSPGAAPFLGERQWENAFPHTMVIVPFCLSPVKRERREAFQIFLVWPWEKPLIPAAGAALWEKICRSALRGIEKYTKMVYI